MKRNYLSGSSTLCRLFVIAAIASGGAAQADNVEDALTALATGDHRAKGYAERNEYRHPVETLMFFGIEPDMTVVEVTPGGGGWYTEIIAPFVRESGRYYAANYDPVSPVEYYRGNARKFVDKLAENLDLYDHTVVTVFAPPNKTDIAPAGSADLVVTFRNTHNWIGVEEGTVEAAFAAMYEALKPGGVLGLVQHREDPSKPQDPTGDSGYMREDIVVGFAEAAGFKLDARSEINANAKDTKDYEEGVWTLPPNLRADEEDQAKYRAIGESDRMTLRFVKPSR